ncbi:MAG: hypothetical protein CVV07_11825 [Gammaproteobacteria bacterium HGW-Gammaproteobacteria-11]|nr:MAG: hypothetical protein CVV07_11825 [Gammaproteobacteria bacterium HGW-Gammaproteobacteria-11]
MPSHDPSSLPALLAGPILRRLEPSRLLVWLVVSRPLLLTLHVQRAERDQTFAIEPDSPVCQSLPIGRHAYVYLVDIPLDEPLPLDTLIDYDLCWVESGQQQCIASALPHLLYPGRDKAAFMIASNNSQLLHGSCRKPHAPCADGLVRADAWLAERLDRPEQRPAWLLMTGDQVYVDDVAGPMLHAVHQLVECLGLFDERLEGATVADSQALYQSAQNYYQRVQLLPDIPVNLPLRERFFGGVKKPVFTSANAQNHLITLAEMFAMYLLVWSPVPWRLLDLTPPALSQAHAQRYAREKTAIEGFVTGLPQVARLMAHLPSLMIFDDHDVTDDWNLTADWESTAYGHPFSRRIIGNALLGYLLCQGWGNEPHKVDAPLQQLANVLHAAREQGWLDKTAQDACINTALGFHGWSYEVAGQPHLLVLDTRTQRWRNSSRPARPSGLMDWEALSEMQQKLLDKNAVIIVSPAPMFGVKLIEGIQKLFTLLGKPLLVDAENWMAHRGAASVMLNIFRHSRTPTNFVVLSGDVHYSFMYDVTIRHRNQAPGIVQITSSGLKNSFPETLLNLFDRLNRWLYAPWSPLNWLTKRRRMRVTPLDPDRAKAGERLWNGSGIGLVRMDQCGRPVEVKQLDARGFEVSFLTRP